jgi:hypothetical protein
VGVAATLCRAPHPYVLAGPRIGWRHPPPPAPRPARLQHLRPSLRINLNSLRRGPGESPFSPPVISPFPSLGPRWHYLIGSLGSLRTTLTAPPEQFSGHAISLIVSECLYRKCLYLHPGVASAPRLAPQTCPSHEGILCRVSRKFCRVALQADSSRGSAPAGSLSRALV